MLKKNINHSIRLNLSINHIPRGFILIQIVGMYKTEKHDNSLDATTFINSTMN